MLERADITTSIKEYIVRESFSQKDRVREETLRFENGLLDSMGFLFLIDFLKQEFQIEVQNCDLVDDNFRSINTISAFVIKELEQIE